MGEDIDAKLGVAAGLVVRYLNSARQDDTDLVYADKIFTAALDSCSAGGESVASGFHDHATALFLLFHDGTDWALLKRAIERERCAIARAAPDHPGLGVMWARLVEMLEAAAAAAGRYGVEDDHGELAAIVGAALSSGFETARLHLVQATMARRRFDREPDLAVLGEAIDAAHRAAESAGEVLVSALMKEADLRHVRWRRADDRDDLDAAVELRLRALAVGPGPAQLSALHAGLCGAYRDRFERFLQVRDIERAVSFGRRVVRSCPEDQGRQRASCLTNLSGAYRTRFEHTRRPKDFRRAVVHARAAVDASPPGDPERPRHLSMLTLALWCGLRFHWDPTGADEAMRASREALELTGTGRHPLRPALLANAANVLRVRYEWTRDLTDLNESVAMMRSSVDATGKEDVARFRRRAGLCAVLLRRFENTGERADADAAVRQARGAWKDAPKGHGQRLGLGMNAGLALYRRYEAYRAEGDLFDCLRAYGETVEATPADHPDLARWRSQMSAPARELYLLTGDEADLDLAVSSAAAGAHGTDDGGAWFNLGMALSLAHERDVLASEDRNCGRAAEDAFRQAVLSERTAPWNRAAAAVRLARLSAGRADWEAADAAYGEALRLLPVLTGRDLGWDSRQRQLSHLAGLGVDAAAVALRQHDRARALLILEQARGVLIGQSVEQQHDVAAVRRVDEGLADEFERLAGLLGADTAALPLARSRFASTNSR